MKATRAQVVFCLLTALAASLQAQSSLAVAQGDAQPGPIVEGSLLISGGTLIDGSGAPPLDNAQVLIRGGMIAEISTSRPTSGDAEVIDARGRFIVPGFVDSHVHYRDWHSELFLAHGVTTVYDLGNPYYWQAALKQGFNSGRMRGPRYYF